MLSNSAVSARDGLVLVRSRRCVFEGQLPEATHKDEAGASEAAELGIKPRRSWRALRPTVSDEVLDQFRGDFAERADHELAFAEARMRDVEAGLVDFFVAIQNQIQIECARGVV